MRTLSKKDVENLIVGATIMGVGGGGDPNTGLKSVLEAVEQGKKVVLIGVDELRPDDLLASPYYVGSVAPTGRKVERRVGDPMAEAAALLEGTLGKKLRATVSSEIGGGNTGACLAISAKLGVPTVDGDLMGRAGPELHQSTANIFGYPMTPSAIVAEAGNRVVVHAAAGIDEYEAIARHISVVSGGHAAVVDTPLLGTHAQKCVVRGTLTQCITIGEARQKALDSGDDPIQAVASKLRNGKLIFRGRVSAYNWKDTGGFLVGEVQVDGVGEHTGKKLKTWIKNEHIVCWVEGKPVVLPPDLIVFLEPATALGITNDKLSVGQEVVVVGASVDEVWRSEAGIRLFGPRHFGFDYEYTPFENLAH
ncbi:MAG: DUF917 domain-containing protein [Thermoprotei archaeon]